MLKSSFLRRVVILVLATILLSASLTAIIFIPTARKLFANMRASEMQLKAEYIAEQYLKYWAGLINLERLQAQVGNNAAWGAQAFLFNASGLLEIYTISPNTAEGTQEREYAKASAQAFASTLSPHVASILSTGEGLTIIDSKTYSMGYLLVGVPVTISDVAIGAVFLCKPLTEVNTSLNSLNFALIFSMLLVFVLMLVPCYFATRVLIYPVNQMKDVALAMAGGNFGIRAKETQKGEIGELGRSLNYLSEQLSRTIAALDLERKRLERIVNGLSEGIVAVDQNGSITHVNPAIEQMFGCKADSSANRMDLIADHSLWEDFDSTVATGCPVMRSLNSGKAVLRVSISPLEDEEGCIAGAVGLFHDITESERLEQTRRDYVANVSHELRTPVAAVRGFAEALSDGLVKTEEARQRYYGHILRETLRLSRLIDDLLELSRLQSGSVALEKVRVDLGDLLLSVVDCYGSRAEDVGVALKSDVPEDCPKVFSNADRIEQVLVILLDNALKFTPDGGSVAIGARPDAEQAIVYLSDTGCGIDPTDLPHVFDRFYKADKAHAHSGTGLGLSIAWEIMQLMGEKIWVESRVGEGTTFFFTLHYAQVPAKPTAPLPGKPSAALQPPAAQQLPPSRPANQRF